MTAQARACRRGRRDVRQSERLLSDPEGREGQGRRKLRDRPRAGDGIEIADSENIAIRNVTISDTADSGIHI